MSFIVLFLFRNGRVENLETTLLKIEVSQGTHKRLWELTQEQYERLKRGIDMNRPQ